MFRVRTVETLISVASAHHQLGRFQFAELILNRMERDETQARQLAHVKLLPRVGKQQTKNFRANQWE